MLGCKSGFRARALQVNPTIRHIHCMIHRYALASKTLPSELESVLTDVVSMVNYIKASALNTRLFRRLCQDNEADHENLIYHTEIRWLSRGNVLRRFIELIEEITAFIAAQEKPLDKVRDFSAKLQHQKWILKASYLKDIFSKLNALNKSLQGNSATVIYNLLTGSRTQRISSYIKNLI